MKASHHPLGVLLLVFLLGACKGERMPSAEAGHAPGRSHEVEPHHDEADLPEGVVHLTPEQQAAIDLETVPAQTRPLAPQLTTTGEVGFDEERLAHVSAPVSGRVMQVPARLGDEVARGQVLVVLDSLEVGQAKAAFIAARAREGLTRETLEREERLLAERVTSQREVLAARAAALEAAVLRRQVQETLRLYGLGEEQIAALSDGDPEAALVPVRSPRAGHIVEKHVTLGELVGPKRNLFTVADLRRLWIWIDVYERDLGAVHLGDGVEVTVEAFPDRTFEGEVSYLTPRVSVETRTVRARIDVANDHGLLRPGMFAAVRLVDPHRTAGPPAVVVPEPAVMRDGGDSLVFVPLGEGRFGARRVSLGRREGGWVEVLSGVAAGEAVVTTGSFFLKSELAREELGGGHDH
jgi:cobalt-zinc-cadmium efflux system membrane fusion protein